MKTKIIICVLIFAFFLSGSYSEIVDEQLKIAEKSGFSTPNYFGTIFKKQLGISPTAYRKNR